MPVDLTSLPSGELRTLIDEVREASSSGRLAFAQGARPGTLYLAELTALGREDQATLHAVVGEALPFRLMASADPSIHEAVRLLTNERGIPVSVSVFEGNTGDPKTLLPQVEKVQERFGIEQFVMVGDRGMLTQTQIDELREMDGIDWITALRPEPIRKLINDGVLQMGLFDERNLFEVTHPDFPSERLVACRNPELAERRRQKRRALLEATCKELEKVYRMVGRGRLQGTENIRAAVEKLLNNYKVGSYYRLDIRDDGFDFELDETTMAADASPTATLSSPTNGSSGGSDTWRPSLSGWNGFANGSGGVSCMVKVKSVCG